MVDKKYLFLVMMVVMMGSVFAIPAVFDLNSNPLTTSNRSVLLKFNFTESSLGSAKFNWNGTNYSIYDDSLVLFYNFDNRSSLGENDSYVKDLSGRDFNGLLIGDKVNLSWNENGKYNGAFKGNGKGKAYINTTITPAMFPNNFTWSLWILVNNKFNSVNSIQPFLIFDDGGSDRHYLYHFNATNELTFGFGETALATPFTNFGTWTHLVVTATYNNTYIFNKTIYIDGQLKNSVSTSRLAIAVNSLNLLGYFSTGGLNGSIDDVMIWNRTLSQAEITQLYKSQLTKYDTDKWVFQSNQTIWTKNLTKTIPTEIYSAYICATNSTGSENCTTNNVITRIIKNLLPQGNFTTLKGVINSLFYGANTHGTWLRLGATINNGSTQPSNLTWHRDKWTTGGYSYSREDMSLSSYYGNSSYDSFNRTGDTTNITLQYEWARANDVKIMNIISYMPSWLGDNSSGNCRSLEKCPPKNLTYFGEMVKDYINRTTLDGEYLDVVTYEFWNEPDHTSFFMGNLTTDHINKSVEINKMFNATATIVRGAYPTAVIGGLGLANCDSSNMRNNFLANFSDSTKPNFANFFSCHNYISPTSGEANIYTTIQTRLNYIYANCTSLGAEATCKNIYISEFNLDHTTNDARIKNTSSRDNEYRTGIALFYSAVLNSYPTNVTMQTYQWADSVVYGASYPEYPQQWYSVQEPTLGEQIRPPYNVTKAFSTLCPAGASVYTTTSDDDLVKMVSCKKGNDYGIIIINTDTEARNISLDTQGELTQLENYETGSKYFSNSPFELGLLDAYEILYLRYEGTDENLIAQFKLNENYSTTAYDNTGVSSDGTISGATWRTDGILVTLTNAVDYAVNTGTGLFTASSDYLYSWLDYAWDYENDNYKLKTTGTIGLTELVGLLPLIIIVVLVGIVLVVVLSSLSKGGIRDGTVAEV